MLTRKIEGDSIIFYDGITEVLSVKETEHDDMITVEMKGELRGDTAHEIQDELIALVTVGLNIAVDVSGVTYVAPTVQHVFLRAQQKIDAIGKGSLVLTGLSDQIYHEFEKTGISELLMIKH